MVRALDLDVGIAAVVFLTMANSLLTLVPTPGGLGAVESGVAGLAVRLSTLTGNFAAALVRGRPGHHLSQYHCSRRIVVLRGVPGVP